MVDKQDFYMSLTEEQQRDGWIKFNIPNPEKGMRGINGEGVWGWLSPEDKEKWADDKFTGKISAILLNDPLNFAGQLMFGSEVVIQCHGENRPTLDVEWAKENLMFPEEGEERNYRVFFNGGKSAEVRSSSIYNAIRSVLKDTYENGEPFALEGVETLED